MRQVFGQSGILGRIPIVLLAGAGTFFFCAAREAALAEELTGYMDLTYFHTQGDSRSSLGQETTTESNGFRQQYGLTLNKALYPKLHLLASGIFERTRVTMSQNDTGTTAISTLSQPLIDLTLRDPFFTVGGTWSRQETRTENVGVTTATLFNETYSGIFSWRPDALPTIDLRWRDANVYDRTRSTRDQNDEMLSFITTYVPVRNLRLRYASIRDDVQDKVQDTETRTTSDSSRVNYDAGFFSNRVVVSANYQNNRQHTELVKSSTGVQQIPQFAFTGLVAIDDTPTLGALDPNLQLVDGDTTASAGITIGLPVTVPGARNMGLDFGTPVKVDTLSLWVTWNNTSLPGNIAGIFSWSVYTSSDNMNWTFQTMVFPAVFDPVENRFDIAVPGLTTRYLKVVVNPLTPADVAGKPPFSTATDQQIYVTELKGSAIVTRGGEVVTSTQIVDGSLRARLAEAPLLFYDFAYYSSLSGGLSSARRSTITNGLSLSHQFNAVFSGSSRLLREDNSAPEGDTVSYGFNATVSAVPLRTLSHTLTYNLADIQGPQETTRRSSWYLTSIATLYRGFDVNLSGGLSAQTGSTGAKRDSTTIMLGASIAPRANLNINPSYSAISTEQSVGGRPTTTSATRTEDLSISYAPLPTVYLSGSWSKLTQAGRRDRIENYGITWSPFPGGALQLSVSYTENWRSTDDNLTRLLSETARWNITSRAFLMLSYYDSNTTSATIASDSKGYNAELRYAF